jgi:methylmalonyl-CoA mutase cobalamin-binding subunit
MHDLQFGLTDRRSDLDAARFGADIVDVERFASQVVSMVAARSLSAAAPLNERLLSDLTAAAASGDSDRVDAALGRMRRARIPSTVIADSYVPAAARRLGEAWMEDAMSFASVSVGVGRLQALLRSIGGSWIADHNDSPDSPMILFVTPQSESHVLGAMVAMTRLRRAGVSVCLKIAPAARDVATLCASRSFAAVMISIACREGLESAAQLVKTVREGATCGTPVIVGGAALDFEQDVLARTGADFATSDIDSALGFCGVLRESNRASRRA